MKKITAFLAVMAFGPTWAPAVHAATSPLDQFSVSLLGHMARPVWNS